MGTRSGTAGLRQPGKVTLEYRIRKLRKQIKRRQKELRKCLTRLAVT